MARLSVQRLGEFGLIEALRRRAGASGGAWVRGIGDDAAVLRPRVGRDLVVTADALIEDVHFRWSTTDGRALGHKALAVNLSDLAAMGARPLGFLLSWGLPPEAPPEALEGFVVGLLGLARSQGCPLVGGDTVRAPCWQLSLTALGEVARGRALLRSGARPGDRVAVTGALGGAALGLALLEAGCGGEAGAAPFARRQRRPAARLAEGQRLARIAGVRAVCDLSDGLLADAGHIARESGVGIDLWEEALPLPAGPGLRRWSERLALDPVELALRGGEDYELLICLAPAAPSVAALARRLGCRLTQVGRVRAGRGVRLLRAGRPVQSRSTGFQHFKRFPARSEK